MALPMPIPPWLVSRPAEHAEAAQAGLREGLAAAQIWAQANAESARLAEAEKRSNLAAKLREEEIQQKSIYEAQANATDRAKIQAAIGMAQAKNQQTQATAAEKAQQWAQEQALNIFKAQSTARHQQAMEKVSLPPDAQVEDDSLKAEEAALYKSIPTTLPRDRPAIQRQIQEVVQKRKRLRTPTSTETPPAPEPADKGSGVPPDFNIMRVPGLENAGPTIPTPKVRKYNPDTDEIE